MANAKDELKAKTKSDRAWEKVINELPVLESISEKGFFEIDSKQLKKITGEEPRLITKFDEESRLPKIFSEYKLGILPSSHNSYIIGHYCLFQKINYPGTQPIEYVSIVPSLNTLEPTNITRESTAILSAFNYGILDMVVNSESNNLHMTDYGKKHAPEFDFYINDTEGGDSHKIQVHSPQIEIDGVFESEDILLIIEAKRGLPTDFIIRQLYFPFRSLSTKTDKQIVNAFLTFSMGRIHIHTFEFKTKNEYNSIIETGYRQFSFLKAPTRQTLWDAVSSATISEDPTIPFPQADSIENVMIAAETIRDNPGITSSELAIILGMDARQGGYYGNACCYLEIASKTKLHNKFHYFPTEEGKTIFSLQNEIKRLEIVKQISRHKIFKEIILEHLQNREPIEIEEIEDLLVDMKLVNYGATTVKRRAQTVKLWAEWAVSLCCD